jgi:hypothetical protein
VRFIAGDARMEIEADGEFIVTAFKVGKLTQVFTVNH